MAGWGDVPTGSKNNGLNQPKAREPCTMHCTCHKKLCRISCLASKELSQSEQMVLQTGSSEVTAVAERGPTATLHPLLHLLHVRCATCHKSVYWSWCARPWIHGGSWICRARFQGAASPCSRWPIASFTLPGLTNHVRLYLVYPCILGLSIPTRLAVHLFLSIPTHLAVHLFLSIPTHLAVHLFLSIPAHLAVHLLVLQPT